MYCKYCGQEIDQDSTFCKHCGADLSSDSPSSGTNLKGVSNLKVWFTNLSKGKQICLMVYFLWFWIALVLFYPERDFVVSFAIAVIIIPAALLMLWYAYSHKWFKQGEDRPNISTLSQDMKETFSEPSKAEKSIIKTYPLTAFAAEHGKMQLQRNYDKESSSYIVSYVFTNDDGNKTIVEPAEDLTLLSAEEISSQKYVLCVNVYGDGSLKLERWSIPHNPDDYMPKEQ